MRPESLKAAVIGTGYVGIATAVGLAEHGCSTVLVEQDHGHLAALAEGRIPFYEPGLPEGYAMRHPLVVDGGPLLPIAELRALGYVVERVGDGVDLPELRSEMRERQPRDRASRER